MADNKTENTSEVQVAIETVKIEVENKVEEVVSVVETVVTVVTEATNVEEKKTEVIENVVEEVATGVMTEVTEIKPKTAVELISGLIGSSDEVKKLKEEAKIEVDETTLSILRLILDKSPASLDKITDLIKEVLSDGVLDYKDVPKLIMIVNTVYKTDIKTIAKDFTVTPANIINLIKFIIKLLIEKDVIKCENKENVNELIEVSAQLLEMVVETETVKAGVANCLSCLPWFKKKD